MTRELLQRLLVQLHPETYDWREASTLRAAIESELAQQEPEPVAAVGLTVNGHHTILYRDGQQTLPAYTLLYTAPSAQPAPIDMVLHCPACGKQHIDAREYNSTHVDPYPSSTGGDDPALSWTNPPHKSHLCHGCGHIWRPADVPTNGVAVVQTKGKADSPLAQPAPVPPVPPGLVEPDPIWKTARFGFFHDDGRFEELPATGWENHPMAGRSRWVGGYNDYAVLRAAMLAAAHGIVEASHV